MRKTEPGLESGSGIGLGEDVRRLSSNAPGENIRRNKQNPSKPAIIIVRIQKKKYIYMEKKGMGCSGADTGQNRSSFTCL